MLELLKFLLRPKHDYSVPPMIKVYGRYKFYLEKD